VADKAILFDATKCTACRSCQAACKQWNENDEAIPETGKTKAVNVGSYSNPNNLSPSTWIKIESREVEENNKLRRLFTRRACMHCSDAGCITACPVDAVHRHESGFVTYNKDACIGCGYCVEACPFHVPRYTRNLLTGAAKMDKCTLCTTAGLDRIAQGWEPACVTTCPSGALHFNDRDILVAEGKKRVQALIAKGFNNAYLYGDKELGGLHVMYVLDELPETYELQTEPSIPMATIAWKDVIQPLGWTLGGLTLVGLGLNFLVAREAKRARELPGNKKEEE